MTTNNIVEKVEKLVSKKSSFDVLKESFYIIFPTKATFKDMKKTIFFVISLSILTSVVIGVSFDTVSIFRNVVDYITNIILALFGIVFTGYVFFQALINKELLKRMLIADDNKSKKETKYCSKLQESNEYFVQLMMLYIVSILICIVLKLIMLSIDDGFCLFDSLILNNTVAIIFITIFLYFIISIIWEIKSFVFNIFQIFNGHTGTTVLKYIIEEDNDGD